MDLDDFVSNFLGEPHLKAAISLMEGEAAFIQELFDVLKLMIVLLFVLDLAINGLVELLNRLLNLVEGSEGSHLVHGEHVHLSAGHDGSLVLNNHSGEWHASLSELGELCGQH